MHSIHRTQDTEKRTVPALYTKTTDGMDFKV